MRHVLVSVPGSVRPKSRHATRIGGVDPGTTIEVTIDLCSPTMPEPAGGRTYTHQELAAFGADAAHAAHVARVLHELGLRVQEVRLPTHSMRVSGTVAAMETAFRPRLGMYVSAEDGTYRGREGDYKVPAELDGIVVGIHGFDRRPVARRASLSPASVPWQGLGPADIESLYNFPAGSCEGQQIGIAEFAWAPIHDDLATYCARFRRRLPTVRVVSVRQPSQEFEPEVGLDVQIIAGLCPKAEIFVYYTNSRSQNGWIDLLDEVISGNLAKPVTLSISYGYAEDAGWSDAAIRAINDRLRAAALLGITVCVASGDYGSGAGIPDGKAHVQFPASSPYVLSVGGTMLTEGDEQAWASGGGASGGGTSVRFSRPRWQNVRVASVNENVRFDGRVVPDVAALAGTPGYDVVIGSADRPMYGTSGAAPVWAALLARIDALLPAARKRRFLTPLLYSFVGGSTVGSLVCRDIRSGPANASFPKPGRGYSPRKGYDAVTGWGVPNGRKLLDYLSRATIARGPIRQRVERRRMPIRRPD